MPRADSDPVFELTEEALWSRDEPLQGVHEQSARTLVALAAAIEDKGPGTAAQVSFLRCVELCRAGCPEAFTRAWAWPTARAWVGRALALAAAVGKSRSEGGDVAASENRLDRHLEHFSGFLVAQALIEDRSVRLPSAYRPPEGFVLPGSNLRLNGSNAILGCESHGVWIEGNLFLAPPEEGLGESSASGLPGLTLAPSIQADGREVLLTPSVLDVPWLDFEHARQALAFGDEGHERSAPLVGRAFDLMAKHAPACFAQFRSWTNAILLNDPANVTPQNATNSFAPGCFVAVAVANPYELADTFIHEFHHVRLFCIEAQSPLLRADAAETWHYSPWRDDLRPLLGLLHAAYVYQPVCAYWLDVLSADIEPEVRNYAADQIVRSLLRFSIVMPVLRESGDLTVMARSIVDHIDSSITRIRNAAISHGLHADLPAFLCDRWGKLRSAHDPATGHALTVAQSVALHARHVDASGRALRSLSESIALPPT